MAYSEDQKEKAKALYSIGKSSRDIGLELNIRHTTIANWAKENQWVKGENVRMIQNLVEAESKIMQLATKSERQIVKREAKLQLKAIEFYQRSARKVAKTSLEALEAEPTTKGAKEAMETLKTGMVVEGLVPYYPNATTINNTNAQQNNGLDEPPVINFIGVEGSVLDE